MIYTFYAGCYSKNPDDEGIHLLRLDADSGELRLDGSYYGGDSPSFIIRKGDKLYAANEVGDKAKVSALSVGENGKLTFLNSREVSGSGTCHVAEMHGFLYAANYSSGSIFGVEILSDGSLGKVVSEIRHEGSGPNPDRQTKPYAHSVNHVPGGNMLIAADLGADKLFCYRQQKDGSLIPDSHTVAAPAGGGPRHLAFHPNNKWLYAVMEMGVSLASYTIDGEDLTLAADTPLLAGGFTKADTAADIHFTGNGARIYASVRGQNLLSAFDIGSDGELTLIGSYPTFGDSPRNFCFSPNEDFVLIANQASGHVTVCNVDSKTGAIGKALSSVALPKVSCVINA